MRDGAPTADGRRWQAAVLAGSVLVLLVLTALQVLPPVGRLSSHVAPNAGDPVLITWILEHQARALLEDPAALYAANIFHPEPAAIAWSDNLTAFVPPYLVAWLLSGRSSVLAYNVVTFLGFAGSSLAVLLLARRLLRSPAAALVVAVAFSLATVRRSAVGHTQLAGFLFLPLTFSLLLDLVERRRVRTALLAGLCTAALWYTAIYFFVLAVVVLPVFAVVWALGERRSVDRRLVGLAAVAGVTAALAVGPSLPPYLDLQAQATFERTDEELLTIGEHSFGQPGSLVYRALDQVDATGEGQDGFVGWTVVVLALVALVGAALDRRRRSGGRDRRTQPGSSEEAQPWDPDERRRRFAVPLAAACTGGALLALGPDDGLLSLPYDALRGLVPGLESARALNRFWALPVLGLALLAGRGVERLLAPAPRGYLVPGALVVVAVLLAELFVRPGTAAVADGPEQVAVNEALADRPDGVVTELPVPTLPDYPYVLAIRQLRSLEDGFPRVEGYSGDAPAGLPEFLQATSSFPAPAALRAMRQAGVRHVVLHGADEPCVARYGPEELDAVLAAASTSPEVEDVSRVGRSAIVTLTDEPGRGPLTDLVPVAPLPRTTTSCERS